MKILVTGGAGFIGSHVVNRLLAEGWQVTALDNLSTGLIKNINPRAEFVKMDIRSSELEAVFQASSFDYVVHLAAQTAVPISLKQPAFDCDVNIMGTVNVLEACQKFNVKKVMFASSAAVYGDCDTVPIPENACTGPSSFYGLSKLTVEHYLELYRRNFGLNYAALRYANVYGERQGDAGEGGVVSIFCRKIHHGEKVTVFGDGNQSRDFIYAGDVAEANYRVILAPAHGIFNISTQTETSVNELFGLLSGISERQVEKIHEAAREGDIYRSSLDNTRARVQLGWKPQMDLREGLARTYLSLI